MVVWKTAVECVGGCGPDEGVACEEAGGIERGCERHRVVETDEPVSGAVSVKALDLRWAANTATGVRTEGEVDPRIGGQSGAST